MKTQFVSRPEQNVQAFQTEAAEYCGLSVEVLCRMEHCSLVRYRDREFIGNTEDLRCAVLGSVPVSIRSAEPPRIPQECVTSPASCEAAKYRDINSVVGRVGKTFHASGNHQLQVA